MSYIVVHLEWEEPLYFQEAQIAADSPPPQYDSTMHTGMPPSYAVTQPDGKTLTLSVCDFMLFLLNTDYVLSSMSVH